jgi:hypothetical protein
MDSELFNQLCMSDSELTEVLVQKFEEDHHFFLGVGIAEDLYHQVF